jgi:hypothetical protein
MVPAKPGTQEQSSRENRSGFSEAVLLKAHEIAHVFPGTLAQIDGQWVRIQMRYREDCPDCHAAS